MSTRPVEPPQELVPYDEAVREFDVPLMDAGTGRTCPPASLGCS